MDLAAVGYLRGRGGADTRSPEDSIAGWRESIAALREAVDVLEAQGVALDEAMAEVAGALHRTQPPMYRQVSLRWWKLGAGRRREPLLVRLESAGVKLAKVTPIGRHARLRTDRGFGLSAELTHEAVGAYWALSYLRTELRELVTEARRTLRRGTGRRAKVIAPMGARMKAIQAEGIERLRAVGYDLPGLDVSDDAAVGSDEDE